jgi:hypothetical protein
MKEFLILLFLIVFGIVLNPLLPFVHILHEYFFHPKHVQKREHADVDWNYDTIKIPHESTSRDGTFLFERDVKYNEEENEYYLKNRRPYCNGKRWEPKWNEVESDKIIEAIKKQL